jgi:hypothetical protein
MVPSMQHLKRMSLAALFLAAISLLGACDLPHHAAPVRPLAAITFQPATSYGMALEAVTNLGLQPAKYCYEVARASGYHPEWHPGSWEVGWEDANPPLLLVSVTLMAPADWLDQIRRLPGVAAVESPFYQHCSPSLFIGPQDTSLSRPSLPDVKVSFAPTVSYNQALEVITALDLQLTDPCDEAAVRGGAHPPWHPQGQEAFFASQHALVALVTILAPDDWQARAQAIPIVTAVQTTVCL